MGTVEEHPLSFGQLSVLRDARKLDPDRGWQANLILRWEVPAGVTTQDVLRALENLALKHEVLRTTYCDLDGDEPGQIVHGENRPNLVDMSPTGAEPGPGHGLGKFVMHRTTPAEGFDLLTDFPWRALVKTHRGRPVGVEFEIHHIAADAAASDVLHRDFLALLAGTSLPKSIQPRDLAEEQHSMKWNKRHKASKGYLERILRGAAELPRVPDGNAGLTTHVGTVRSQRALAHARSTADRLGITASTVLSAAFTRTLASLLGSGLPPVYFMSSNRHLPRYKDLVASMNQWVPFLPDPAADEAFDTACLRLHGLRMAALRYSCFNPDMASALRGELTKVLGGGLAPGVYLNHVPATDGAERAGREELDVVWRDLGYTAEPGFFCLLTELGGFTMAVRATWSGVEAGDVEGLLHGVHRALTA